MTEPLAYFAGQWLPYAQLAVPIQDAGFVQGATVAEQLRTFGGRLFRLERHLERLARSLAIVGVTPRESLAELQAIAERLVVENHARLAPADDLNLGLFVTPGDYGAFDAAGRSQPRVCIYTIPLPFATFAAKYEQGESLVVSSIRQTPPECWPPELKCRSRMHYFLADREARTIKPGARALLLDLAGRVTEASTANLVVYRAGEGLVSPPRETILPGVSVAMLEELAGELGLPWIERPLDVDDVATADEAFLSSTSPCILPVVRLGGAPLGSGRPGPVFGRLLAAWSARVGVDIAGQARRFARRGA